MDNLNEVMRLHDAVKILFPDISLTKHKKIKSTLTSYVTNGMIRNHKEAILSGEDNTKYRRWVYRDQLTLIHNIIVLQGLFGDTRILTDLLADDTDYRHDMADVAHLIFNNKTSIMGIDTLPAEVERFIAILGSEDDLRRIKLPNPFVILPQQVINGPISIIQAALAGDLALSQADSMMLLYINGDLEKAYAIAKSINTNDRKTNKYCQLILEEYQEANDFDELLDILQQ